MVWHLGQLLGARLLSRDTDRWLSRVDESGGRKGSAVYIYTSFRPSAHTSLRKPSELPVDITLSRRSMVRHGCVLADNGWPAQQRHRCESSVDELLHYNTRVAQSILCGSSFEYQGNNWTVDIEMEIALLSFGDDCDDVARDMVVNPSHPIECAPTQAVMTAFNRD